MATTEKAARKAQVGVLLGLIDEAFDKRSWHGTNLRGALRGIDVRVASWRPGPGRHNIWELALHAAYWKYAVRRRLTGEKRGAFGEKGSDWFVRPAAGESWEHDLAHLVREHRLLRDEVAKLRDQDLPRRIGTSRWTRAAMVRGIAAHDLYHTGQIQVIKRMLPAR
jgi:uncharacterized damage-inducible protein DinB